MHEIMWELPYKRMMDLISARQKRLTEEEEEFQKNTEMQERQNIRNNILAP